MLYKHSSVVLRKNADGGNTVLMAGDGTVEAASRGDAHQIVMDLLKQSYPETSEGEVTYTVDIVEA